MEPGLAFTALVFSIGALHLIWQAADRISKYNHSVNKTSKPAVKRDDWYVFFHRSDLLGPTVEEKKDKSTNHQRPANGQRPAAKRPARPARLS